MFAFCIFFFVFMANSNSCLGCMPTPQHDDYLIPPYSFSCDLSAGAEVETSVKLVDSGWGLAETRICQDCPPGRELLHFSSTSTAIPNQASMEAAGTIDISACSAPFPCVCDAGNNCYQLETGGAPPPAITLYPYCDASGCFLTVLLTTQGRLVSSIDPTMFLEYADQRDAAGNLKPVTDQDAFPRIKTVGCDGCVEDPQCPSK